MKGVVVLLRRLVYTALSLVLVIVGVGGILIWEFYLDDKVGTKNVVFAANSIERGQAITPADIVVKKMPIELVPEDAEFNPNDVIGFEAAHPISAGSPIVTTALDKEQLLPGEDQMIVPIPDEWIYAYPGSLRRKDRVTIYAMPKKPESLIASENVDVKGLERLLTDIPVVYVKDSGNQEVKPTNNEDPRLDASGYARQLEVLLTEKQLSLLQNYVQRGYTFVFTYRY